jgi:hypothetical protein
MMMDNMKIWNKSNVLLACLNSKNGPKNVFLGFYWEKCKRHTDVCKALHEKIVC